MCQIYEFDEAWNRFFLESLQNIGVNCGKDALCNRMHVLNRCKLSYFHRYFYAQYWVSTVIFVIFSDGFNLTRILLHQFLSKEVFSVKKRDINLRWRRAIKWC